MIEGERVGEMESSSLKKGHDWEHPRARIDFEVSAIMILIRKISSIYDRAYNNRGLRQLLQ